MKKPEEGGKCPLGCEDSKFECNQCGNEFVEE